MHVNKCIVLNDDEITTEKAEGVIAEIKSASQSIEVKITSKIVSNLPLNVLNNHSANNQSMERSFSLLRVYSLFYITVLPLELNRLNLNGTYTKNRFLLCQPEQILTYY